MMDDTNDARRLERFRGYLLVLARLQLDSRMQAKLDASDVVQQTLTRAVQRWNQFRGTSDAELAGWLRQIMANDLANVVRDFARDKRDVARECSLEAALERSSRGIEGWLAAEQTSPSAGAQRNEELLRAATALAGLPAAQYEAVTLYHLQSWTIGQIAEHQGRSTTAVAGLIKRGLKAVREQLS